MKFTRSLWSSLACLELFTPFYPWLKEGGHCGIFLAWNFPRVDSCFHVTFQSQEIGLGFSLLWKGKNLNKDLSYGPKDDGDMMRKPGIIMSGIKHTWYIVYFVGIIIGCT
jgi:hypothetical protein